jgi:hypothetical protein
MLGMWGRHRLALESIDSPDGGEPAMGEPEAGWSGAGEPESGETWLD